MRIQANKRDERDRGREGIARADKWQAFVCVCVCVFMSHLDRDAREGMSESILLDETGQL